MKLFFDGGCRPNPGRMETAVVARGVVYHRPDAGIGTNNDAEWLALIDALAVARALGFTDIQLLGDSALVVGQATGRLTCRGADLKRHLTAFDVQRAGFVGVRIARVSRFQNLAGTALDRMRSGR